VLQTDAAATGDENDFVVERIVDIGQSPVSAGGLLFLYALCACLLGWARSTT
jgi:hypothetical protein